MKAWCAIILMGGAGMAAVIGAPVTARWGAGGGNAWVEVRGFDVTGRLRIAPTDGADGEALLPVSDVGDLRFIFSDAYREAQLRVSIGRPAEALYLLEQEIPAFIPYAVLEESNVPTAVRLYLRLLQYNQKWPKAVAVAAALLQSDRPHPLTPEVLNLVERLIRAERIDDAAWLLSRLPLNGTSEYLEEVVRVAHEMRRAGHWREAETIYLRLNGAPANVGDAYWTGLVAYCAWHRGSPESAARLVADMTTQPAVEWAGLLGLLHGRVALAGGDPRRALDSLGEALIAAPADSEWRLEISAVLADSYHALGHETLARRMREDLRRLHPTSRWTRSVPPT